jgi:hypothetical protein
MMKDATGMIAQIRKPQEPRVFEGNLSCRQRKSRQMLVNMRKDMKLDAFISHFSIKTVEESAI